MKYLNDILGESHRSFSFIFQLKNWRDNKEPEYIRKADEIILGFYPVGFRQIRNRNNPLGFDLVGILKHHLLNYHWIEKHGEKYFDVFPTGLKKEWSNKNEDFDMLKSYLEKGTWVEF